MTSGFVPLKFPLKTRARLRPGEDLRLARWALAVAVLLELMLLFFPQAMVLDPAQASILFKRISGYSMVSLLAFSMLFGSLRRLPAMSGRQPLLHAIHQCAGLLILLLLALHVGARPSGFLLFTFHAMAIGLGAGALRSVLGPRAGRRGSTLLLALHIGLTCLVSAGVLLHLYFVYAYMA